MYSPCTLTTTIAAADGADAVVHEPQLGAGAHTLMTPSVVTPTNVVPEIDTWFMTAPGRAISTHAGGLGPMSPVYLMALVSLSNATTREPLIATWIADTPLF